MKLINRKGNLNALNQHFQTPLAFSGEYTLRKLNLLEGVATFEPTIDANGIQTKPKFDNNKLLIIKSDQSSIKAKFKNEIESITDHLFFNPKSSIKAL